MKTEIESLSEILDDTITKGEELSKGSKSKINHYEEQILKGFSHDPWSPREVGPDTEFYNPYKWAPEGGFYPHSVGTLQDMGFRRRTAEGNWVPGDYSTVQQFYAAMGVKDQGMQGFRGFSKSIDKSIEIVKAHIPTNSDVKYKDGRQYRKTEDGWRPVGDGMGDRLRKQDQKAHKELDEHYATHSKIKSHLQRKQDAESVRKDTVKQTMTKVKQVLAKLFDGPLPASYRDILDAEESK